MLLNKLNVTSMICVCPVKRIGFSLCNHPSINEMSYELEVSRDTIEKAYRHLKSLGIIGSVPGTGYFITKTDFRQNIKVFLIFNKLSAHKKIIYDSFVNVLGEKAAIDFYIYNNDFNLFKKLLQNRKGNYTLCNYPPLPGRWRQRQ